MKNQTTNSVGVLLAVGIIFTAWGVLGLLDSKNYTYTGYSTDGNYSIVQIEENSPAAIAGLRKGDVIVSTGGIYVTDSKALNNRLRPEIGESRELVIKRNGEEMSMDLTYTALPERQNLLNIVSYIIGLVFIILGVFMHSQRKTALSMTFGIFMLCFGFIFFQGPYITPGVMSQLVGSISITIVLFSFAALANYLLNYPPKSRYNARLLYFPAGITALFFWILEFTLPDSTTMLNMSIRFLVGAVIIFYFGLSLYTLIRKYLKASREDRKASGLNLMLVGAIIGLLPILVYFTVSTVAPAIILPGNDYVFLTFIAIPVFFSLALLQNTTLHETPVQKM